MPGFWSRLQVVCLAMLVPSSLSMILLYPSPIHVLFEGLVIVSGIMLVSAFRRVYTYLLFFVSLYLLAIARIYDIEGMRANNLAYIYLTSCIAAALLLSLLVEPRFDKL